LHSGFQTLSMGNNSKTFFYIKEEIWINFIIKLN